MRSKRDTRKERHKKDMLVWCPRFQGSKVVWGEGRDECDEHSMSKGCTFITHSPTSLCTRPNVTLVALSISHFSHLQQPEASCAQEVEVLVWRLNQRSITQTINQQTTNLKTGNLNKYRHVRGRQVSGSKGFCVS